MLKSQVVSHHPHPAQTLIPYQKPLLSGIGVFYSHPQLKPISFRKQNNFRIRRNFSNSIKAIFTSTKQSTTVIATVTVKIVSGTWLSKIGWTQGIDTVIDWFGHSIHLELVSSELDPKTGLEKPAIKGYAKKKGESKDEVKYECKFTVPKEFGEIGAILVENEHHKEMHFMDITLDNGLTVNCHSWVAPKSENPNKRIFFTDKSYLPSNTPDGLKRMREQELVEIRGNGQEKRKEHDRIYDYDVYNDLGDPDNDIELKRPVLGGKNFPYPRRCRTGRPRCKKDPFSESKDSFFYVPRDEAFSDIKSDTFTFKTLFSALHAVVPALETIINDKNLGFRYFTRIDSLFNEGINAPNLPNDSGFLRNFLPRAVKFVKDTRGAVLQFETPELFERDKFSWFRDEEFARQTLAGMNPYSIQLVTEWPLKSKLDPQIYGPPESAITKELIEREIKGFMTVEEAVKQKKLFMLDYHDLFLPYVRKVRSLEGTTLYGSRTLFFLTHEGTLRPLVIELTRPPMDDKPQWKEVFTPCWDSTGMWLWRLAKTHVLAHDTGYHQLVSHWLRTHCCTEPYIIATNRQLSVNHPIFRLLHPHFRYTMEINALARQKLINAGGIIESTFTPGKYSIELSSIAYDLQWRFDQEALPADLIKRGMAVEDPTAPHGLKLAVEDYPFANDGLILWDAIKQWVTDYVNYFYADSKNPDKLVKEDNELQAWWTEIRTVGHGDKKDEPWWPKLETREDLIGILTTIIWVASGHHAAVNFGQYAYAGYFPNRPTIARNRMPTEDKSEREVEWKSFLEKPEVTMLSCFPTQYQATTVMTVLDVLSSHCVDEEYIGGEIKGLWEDYPVIKAAYENFNGNLKKLEGIIDARNADLNLKNRSGAGVVPYELLKPYSEAGVTAKGVPNSISI
ncbi:linoleate 13S-lipoxygenase 2-1, chloroplastic-like [Actinidia eriantha]|uniref:linoleate 13S-lipoxygenase 2-1, chloroplastic-like n=1 Tax=Actinidia eriantha TaxID=165200 RepID=UPI0025882909|nr:linoleate 13S-lipoxygenase 2-1, chloroplastic-like [Actinidia eriantha]